MVKYIVNVGGALFVAMTLIGCASSGVINHVTPVAVAAPVSIDFALVETGSGLPDCAAEERLLNQIIVSDLRGRGVFEEVEGSPTAAGTNDGIKVQIEIKEIKKISRSEREWAGALAGRAHLSVQATVSDLGSGKMIEKFDAQGESSGGSNLAGTTDEAVQRVAELVVAEVIKLTRITGP